LRANASGVPRIVLLNLVFRTAARTLARVGLRPFEHVLHSAFRTTCVATYDGGPYVPNAWLRFAASYALIVDCAALMNRTSGANEATYPPSGVNCVGE
jgi:hypothetical protein